MPGKPDEQLKQLYFSQYAEMVDYLTKQEISRELAEDLVQDTFHDALNQIHEFHTHPHPDRWLWVIMKHKMQDYFRQLARDRAIFAPYDIDWVSSVRDPAFNYIVQDEINDIFRTLEGHFDKENLYIFRRVVFDKASYQEIASELDIPLWTVQKRMQRIRAFLHKKYPDHGVTKKNKILKIKLKLLLLLFS